MAIQTYITAAEATTAYPQDQDYSAGQRSLALTTSYGLVNGYVSSKLAIPIVAKWDGESTISAPEVLKECQHQFYQWKLESINNGWTQELQNKFDAAVKLASGITQDQLTEPGAETYEHQAGWHITKITNADSNGTCEVTGAAPSLSMFYRIVITTGGYAGSGAIVFDAYRSDLGTAHKSGLAGSFISWTSIDDGLSIRFDGQWKAADEIRIAGVPHEQVNAAAKSNTLKTGAIAY